MDGGAPGPLVLHGNVLHLRHRRRGRLLPSRAGGACGGSRALGLLRQHWRMSPHLAPLCHGCNGSVNYVHFFYKCSVVPAPAGGCPSSKMPPAVRLAQLLAVTAAAHGEASALPVWLAWAKHLARRKPCVSCVTPHLLARPPAPEAQAFQPPSPLVFNSARLVSNLRSTRREAAPDPSSATAEHYRILLDDDESTSLLARRDLARANVPAVTLEGLRLGRIVAWAALSLCRTSPSLSRWRSTFTIRVPLFSTPFPPTGAECLARFLRAPTKTDREATVFSVDGVGVFDVFWASVFAQLTSHGRLAPPPPYVRRFVARSRSACGATKTARRTSLNNAKQGGGGVRSTAWGVSASQCLWYDQTGAAHVVEQGETGGGGPRRPKGLW